MKNSFMFSSTKLPPPGVALLSACLTLLIAPAAFTRADPSLTVARGRGEGNDVISPVGASKTIYNVSASDDRSGGGVVENGGGKDTVYMVRSIIDKNTGAIAGNSVAVVNTNQSHQKRNVREEQGRPT